MHLLFRVACPAVRMTFDKEIQPDQLRKLLDVKKLQMERQYRNREHIINDFQWKMLYPKLPGTKLSL